MAGSWPQGGDLIGCRRFPARGDLLAPGKRIISGFFLRFVLLMLSFAEDGVVWTYNHSGGRSDFFLLNNDNVCGNL